MHDAAMRWVERFATSDEVSVLDIGGRNINGSVKDLFPNASRYVSVDLYDGPGVDVACDITQWESDETFDVVVCCEVLEHSEKWRKIVATALERCKDGGQLIVTCAGPGRPVHSGVDGGWSLKSGEYYGNVVPEELGKALNGFTSVLIDVLGTDLRAVAIK